MRGSTVLSTSEAGPAEIITDCLGELKIQLAKSRVFIAICSFEKYRIETPLSPVLRFLAMVFIKFLLSNGRSSCIPYLRRAALQQKLFFKGP